MGWLTLHKLGENVMARPQRYIENVEKNAYTEDEYFAFERRAFGRWEFVPTGPPAPEGSRLGDIRAMSGGTPDHSTIAFNIIAALHRVLVPKGCRVFGSDLKVRTGDEVNTFPDVSVVCGPLIFYRSRNDVITNPLLIVEVLSDSTEEHDRNEKFSHYQTIPTLTNYLFVAQDRTQVLLYTRQSDHWDMRVVSGLTQIVYLPSVDVTLSMADVDALIEFADAEIAA